MSKSFIIVQILSLFFLIGITSCSTDKNDLITLTFGQSIAELINSQKLEEFQDPIYGIYTYKTDQLDGFKIGDIKLSTYKYPNSPVADFNRIQVYVDDRIAKQYLGFRYNTVKQDEIPQLLEYFKMKYPTYETTKDSNGVAYFWEISSLDAWLFYYPSTSVDRNGKDFLNSNFLYVKKTTRMENNTNYNTILDHFNMMYPKK